MHALGSSLELEGIVSNNLHAAEMAVSRPSKMKWRVRIYAFVRAPWIITSCEPVEEGCQFKSKQMSKLCCLRVKRVNMVLVS